MRRTTTDLAQQAAHLLGTGALTRDELVDALAGDDTQRGELSDQLAKTLQFDTTFSTVSSGVVYVPTLLEGTTWTMYVDAKEASEDFVRSRPYLEPLSWWLVGSEVSLVDGDGVTLGELETDAWDLDGVDTDVILGPDGWLRDVAGAWAAVEVVGGNLRWSPCPVPPEATARQIAALRDAFERTAEFEAVEMYEDAETELRFALPSGLVKEALLADRAAFVDAPIPPLPALFEAAGFEVRNDTVARPGFDWAALRSWQRRNGFGWRYELDERGAELLELLTSAYSAVLAGDPEPLGADDDERAGAALLLVGILGQPDLATAFWSELGPEPDLDQVAQFVSTVSGALVGELPIGLAWLHARCLDWKGHPAEALGVLRAAVDSSDDHWPALIDLATFAADRGDAVDAYRLLQRAGVEQPDEDADEDLSDGQRLLLEVEGFALHHPRPAARRNDRCPCGSGRKYKVCHLGEEQHALSDRAGWLYNKALRFLWRRYPARTRELVAEVVDDDLRFTRTYDRLSNSPLMVDVVLHEGGVFDEFLTARQQLLPADEAMLATQWSVVDRGVFEIRRIKGGVMDLYNLGRGEVVTVSNTTPNEATKPGGVMVGRPLPVGDTHRAYSGFIPLRRSYVEPMLEAIDTGDPFEVAEGIGELFRPPRLHNSDGHEMVWHTIRWRVPGAVDLDEALLGAGLRRDDGTTWTLARDSANQPDTIVLTLRREDDDLVGEVNSVERARELCALIARAVPQAELIDEDVRSMNDMLAERDLDEDPPAPPVETDPDMLQTLAEYIAEYERRWLDMSVPALDGRTPREAAGDPIGREQLEHLFQSMPDSDDPTVMSASRLRAALDL